MRRHTVVPSVAPRTRVLSAPVGGARYEGNAEGLAALEPAKRAAAALVASRSGGGAVVEDAELYSF